MGGFASRVESISISGIRKVFEAAGDDAINLGIGQPDFPTPDHVRRAAVEAIESGAVDGYTSNKGIEPLRQSISSTYADRYGLSIDPADIIATSGGSEALHLVLEAHVEPGQEVIIPDPGFVSYDALTRLAGGVPVPVELRDDLTLDPETVDDAITDRTAGFVVNSPANPTGAVQSTDDMRVFAQIADDRDIFCLSDEVYERIVFDGTHVTPFEFAETDNVIVVSACSKTYSMTGWRLGWVIASNRRIERMLRVHQYAQACASAPAQYAAKAALDGPDESVERMVEAFQQRRDVVLDSLTDMGLDTPIPNGAFYVMPAVPDGWVDKVIEHGVIIVPGDAFGRNGAGHARLSYATSMADIEEAMAIMANVTKSFN